jgi:hypothetical protein
MQVTTRNKAGGHQISDLALDNNQPVTEQIAEFD